MRVPALLPTVFIASAAASALLAQQPRVTRIPPNTIIGAGPGQFRFFTDEPRAVIGVSTTSASTSRDTLGVLVSTVRSGSPAEKAGIEEGNRIASINNVSLKLAAADVGDDQMAGASKSGRGEPATPLGTLHVIERRRHRLYADWSRA